MKKSNEAETCNTSTSYLSEINQVLEKHTWHNSSVFVRRGIDLNILLKNALQKTAPQTTYSPQNQATNNTSFAKFLYWIHLSVKKTISQFLKFLIKPIASRWSRYLSHQIALTLHTELQRQAQQNTQRFNALEETVLQEFKQTHDAIHALETLILQKFKSQ